MYDEFLDAVESIRAQTYDDVEIVIVVDGTQSVCVRAREEFESHKDILIHCNKENRGISYSRTKGAELASGDIVAFIDDDAIADPRWIEELVKTYEETDALAVGGRMEGRWLSGNPWYLPEEFNWLVGVTYPGFAEAGEEVRNTFESNISFTRDVFLDLGGYDTDFGPDADSYSYSEGAEIGARLQVEYGQGVVYNPDAVVEHKVFHHRTNVRWLMKRAFEQGSSKRRMKNNNDDTGGEESEYLITLFTRRVPHHIKEFLHLPSFATAGMLLMLFVFTGIVGLGYLYETLRLGR